MSIFSRAKNALTRRIPANPAQDETEIALPGLLLRFRRKTAPSVPHEFSVFVPRLEYTNKVTEGGKTTETSVVLNSLTVVSAPRAEPAGHTKKATRINNGL